MKTATAGVILTLLLSAALTQGALIFGKGRCLCKEKGSNFIQPKLIQKLEVIPVSSYCDRIEIIVTLKTTGQRWCLNPESNRVQKLISTITKKELQIRKRAKHAKRKMASSTTP
ncbi:C-X-C motif chemokine 10 [Latimeria chalumnae]|uniref:C-X-C motif chemokine 10 n=1 Tax=Latimeria chalumnae TaxID=7897 RepID=UPI0003C1AB57|nr:PREDICTED: C-X-C motif chemokine 10-like [Latimeria chalumnae]|eukprot:XP_006003779.1 PREDICTED: C-X-C motif chemokine 10-like [Latimeria chalumnae]